MDEEDRSHVRTKFRFIPISWGIEDPIVETSLPNPGAARPCYDVGALKEALAQELVTTGAVKRRPPPSLLQLFPAVWAAPPGKEPESATGSSRTAMEPTEQSPPAPDSSISSSDSVDWTDAVDEFVGPEYSPSINHDDLRFHFRYVVEGSTRFAAGVTDPGLFFEAQQRASASSGSAAAGGAPRASPRGLHHSSSFNAGFEFHFGDAVWEREVFLSAIRLAIDRAESEEWPAGAAPAGYRRFEEDGSDEEGLTTLFGALRADLRRDMGFVRWLRTLPPALMVRSVGALFGFGEDEERNDLAGLVDLSGSSDTSKVDAGSFEGVEDHIVFIPRVLETYFRPRPHYYLSAFYLYLAFLLEPDPQDSPLLEQEPELFDPEYVQQTLFNPWNPKGPSGASSPRNTGAAQQVPHPVWTTVDEESAPGTTSCKPAFPSAAFDEYADRLLENTLRSTIRARKSDEWVTLISSCELFSAVLFRRLKFERGNTDFLDGVLQRAAAGGLRPWLERMSGHVGADEDE